jgi:hypothetical protein
MPRDPIVEYTVVAGGAVSYLALLRSIAGVALTQASVAQITRFIKDMDLRRVSSQALTVSDLINDTPQFGPNWNRTDIGYNFRDDLPAGSFATGKRFFLQYQITPTVGDVIVTAPVQVWAQPNATF